MKLDEFLKKETALELSNKTNINEMAPILDVDGVKKVSDLDYHFFKDSHIYISKHERYAKMTTHKHSFVEINYMYSGSCIQYVNNKKVVLTKGQLLIMDKDAIHSIECLNKDDILINILIEDNSISTKILKDIVKSHSLIYEFLDSAASNQHDHNQYLVLETQNNSNVQRLVESITKEYYFNDQYSQGIIKASLSLLFIELSRQLENQTIQHSLGKDQQIYEILRYIDNHYQDITLEKLASAFNYNKNYISNKLKEFTNKSFKQLLDEKRLSMAIYYLKEDELSIENIAYKIGYESPSAFYKLFKKYYSITPFQYKKNGF